MFQLRCGNTLEANVNTDTRAHPFFPGAMSPSKDTDNVSVNHVIKHLINMQSNSFMYTNNVEQTV